MKRSSLERVGLSALLLAGAGAVENAHLNVAAASSPTTQSLSASEAILQPYLPLVEAQRGSNLDSVSFVPTSVAGTTALDGVTEASTVVIVHDNVGSFTLSLDLIPGHSPFAILRTANDTGTTTWIVNTITATVVTRSGNYFSSGPVVTNAPPVTSTITLSSPAFLQPAGAIRPRSSVPPTSSALPPAQDDCTLSLYEVDVIGSPFGPLLDGYETVTCDLSTEISLAGQLQQKNASCQFFGTLQEAPYIQG